MFDQTVLWRTRLNDLLSKRKRKLPHSVPSGTYRRITAGLPAQTRLCLKCPVTSDVGQSVSYKRFKKDDKIMSNSKLGHKCLPRHTKQPLNLWNNHKTATPTMKKPKTAAKFVDILHDWLFRICFFKEHLSIRCYIRNLPFLSTPLKQLLSLYSGTFDVRHAVTQTLTASGRHRSAGKHVYRSKTDICWNKSRQ